MPVALGNSLREAIRSARSGGRTVLYRKGKPAFAIVPAEDAEYMQKLENELNNRLSPARYSEDVPNTDRTQPLQKHPVIHIQGFGQLSGVRLSDEALSVLHLLDAVEVKSGKR